MERARAAVDADGVLDTTEGRELGLERRHLLAENVVATFQDAQYRRIDFGLDRPVLRLQIEERDHATFSTEYRWMVSPLPRIELVAISISSTTCAPSHASVSGARPFSMQSQKCSASSLQRLHHRQLRRPHVAAAITYA